MDLLVTGAVDMGGSGVLGNYNGQQEDIGVRFWAWLWSWSWDAVNTCQHMIAEGNLQLS